MTAAQGQIWYCPDPTSWRVCCEKEKINTSSRLLLSLLTSPLGTNGAQNGWREQDSSPLSINKNKMNWTIRGVCYQTVSIVCTTHVTVCYSGSQLNSWTLLFALVSPSQCRLWTFTASVYHVSKQCYETEIWEHTACRPLSGHWIWQIKNTCSNVKNRDLRNMILPAESWFDCRDVGRCLNQLSLATVAVSAARGDWTACCRWVKVIICWCMVQWAVDGGEINKFWHSVQASAVTWLTFSL